VKDAAQDSRIHGGTQLLAIRLAEELGFENIQLSAPVRDVIQNGDRYIVVSDKLPVSASHVVIAMSPPMVARISYHPLLPAGRDHLTQRMLMR
jgi:monoamine oxidase